VTLAARPLLRARRMDRPLNLLMFVNSLGKVETSTRDSLAPMT